MEGILTVVGVRYKSKKSCLYCISEGKEGEGSLNETEVSKNIFKNTEQFLRIMINNMKPGLFVVTVLQKYVKF
jgi:hypothetical protein